MAFNALIHVLTSLPIGKVIMTIQGPGYAPQGQLLSSPGQVLKVGHRALVVAMPACRPIIIPRHPAAELLQVCALSVRWCMVQGLSLPGPPAAARAPAAAAPGPAAGAAGPASAVLRVLACRRASNQQVHGHAGKQVPRALHHRSLTCWA